MKLATLLLAAFAMGTFAAPTEPTKSNQSIDSIVPNCGWCDDYYWSCYDLVFTNISRQYFQGNYSLVLNIFGEMPLATWLRRRLFYPHLPTAQPRVQVMRIYRL
ncbi:hypothetical protein CC78DRAFT_543350 [Lojkania enalia]|uniref:Uncharacterized protein n=1 Tax=Lojkania enalia TaxID=147567 RepID=A0A9P4KBZ8_9PLEO|nr:hypothetical protein CC78DRAFT_543350 [Didymosphaeria enalia]